MASRIRWIAAGCVLLAAVIVYRFDPSLHGFYPRCVFHALTGLECPGCGGTRALHQLLHGRFVDAYRLNPMLFLMAPFVAAGSLTDAQWTRHRWVGWAAAILLIAWGVFRNTPLCAYR
jgi:hypothetical protein